MKKRLLLIFVSILLVLTSCSVNTKEEKSVKQKIEYPIIIHYVADWYNKNFLACFIGSDNTMYSAFVNKKYLLKRKYSGERKIKTLKQFREYYKYATFESKRLDENEVFEI